MRFFALIFLLGTYTLPSGVVADDDFMLMQPSYFESPSDFRKHRAKKVEDTPLTNPGGSLLKRILPPHITILLPPMPHKSPVQFWRFRITMNANKPDGQLASQNDTRPLYDHNMDEPKVFLQEHKETEARGKSYDSPVVKMIHAFPFLLNPKWQHHERMTAPKGKEDTREEYSLLKQHEKNGLVLLKRKDTHSYSKKPENITQKDYFMHFSRAWSIDWSSVTLHLIFVLATAFLITISVALCHSAVASTRSNGKESTITLDSLKKVKLLNSENSNMC